MDELGCGGSSDTGVRSDLRTFYILGKSAKNPFTMAHLRILHHQLESEKKMNQENLHEKKGQQPAPQSAQKCAFWKATMLNFVLGENLEDQKLGASTTRNWIVDELLHSLL